MKRSRVIVLTMAGISLSLTGCRRGASDHPAGAATSIIPPGNLDPQLRATLPAFRVDENLTGRIPPQNAYDDKLGYYHESCAGWFPYPYNYHDPRYGYYRCGRWYKDSGTTRHPHTHGGAHRPWRTGTPRTETMDPQPSGAPIHEGIPHANAADARNAMTTSRGGFGSTGHRSGGFFSRS